MPTDLPPLPTPESYGFRNGRPDPKQPLFAVDDVEDYARECYAAGKAATLATVTPLVQQLADALENERLRAPHRKIGLWGPARHAARAFLSGATKGEPS